MPARAFRPRYWQKTKLIFLLFWLFASKISLAETPADTSHYSQLADQLFIRLLEKPDDITLNRKLFQAQIKSGQLKAAIASLERLDALTGLDQDTQIIRISLLITVGNIAEAQAYLHNIDPSSLSREKRQQVTALTSKINQIQSHQNKRLFASITASIGQDSNPSGATHGNQAQFYLPASNKTVTGTSSKMRKTDEISEMILSVHHITPHPDGFDWQLAVSGETALTSYSHYNQADASFYSLAATIEQLQQQFYARISAISAELAQQPFVHTFGASSGISFQLSNTMSHQHSLSISASDYHQPEDTDRTGIRAQIASQFNKKTAPQIPSQIKFDAALAHYQAEADWHGFNLGKFGVVFEHATPPLNHKIDSSITLKRYHAIERHFNSGNPVYSASDIRADRIVSAFIDSMACFSKPTASACSGIGLRTSFQQTKSNIANFSQNSASIKLYLAHYF